MRKLISGVSVAFLLLMLFGCGAANLNSSLNSQQMSIASGNWSFGASSSTRPGTGQFLIGGHLEQHDHTVSGILHVASSRCFNVDKDVAVSGTIEGDTLSLTSLPIKGQTLRASLIGHDSSMVGSYSFTGGCSNGDEGSLTANLMPTISGMWNALDEHADKSVSSVSLALAQSDNANGHGVYPLSGTLTSLGSQCQISGRITSGYLAGSIVVINSVTQESSGGTGAMRIEGDLAAGIKPSITGAFSYSAGACRDQAGVLTFTP
ncbi:hypothetical protein Acid345_3434 [Candidatus Koribacter versatilis Ellin345]|uniref:Lipoprotein n=1 Tax=Koribacter versatilis (strain Ellin345) TaxID=204669 RepID=Q1IL15_KORVE|nr:hypothetical protein [Candidatus Koribacter versatilis]ABF42435.1 hypothetical protein Acid345_3434 [Candidatus Koribacter versatilis Ellin345]